MRIVEPEVFVENFSPTSIMTKLERIGRLCYKSGDKIEPGTADKFIAGLVKSGHEAMIEHASFTARFICNRGVSHELVRHRPPSFAQESQRYCCYLDDKFGNEVTFINPFFHKGNARKITLWKNGCAFAEETYLALLGFGDKPEEARGSLLNDTKTELYITANVREWRHILTLRADVHAHPQMRQVAIPLLLYLQGRLPILFNDISYDTNFNEEDYAEVFTESF